MNFRASPEGSVDSLNFSEESILTQTSATKIVKTIDVSDRDLRGIFKKEFQMSKIK